MLGEPPGKYSVVTNSNHEIPVYKIIIADNQAIYRAGVTKLLSARDDNHIVAQCHDCSCLSEAVVTFPNATVIVASALKPDFAGLMQLVAEAQSRAIVIAENIESHLAYTSKGASGVVFRDAESAVFLDCVRRVAAGDAAVAPVEATTLAAVEEDVVGANVLARFALKELRIVSLIAQGMKNKEIAARLSSSEQVIKNYLHTIFDKTGVTDRLELALFTLHHRVLAEAAGETAASMEAERANSSPAGARAGLTR
jgi:DNA-binding NarL/FixJ family response regulator